MRAYLTLLRENSDFTRLWIAQIISLLGDWFNTIALSALVVAYNPENPGLAVSALLLCRYLPPMLLGPFVGVLLDRFDRKSLLVWSNLLRVVVVLGFLLATTGREWLWLIYVLSVAQFVLSSVFEPGQQALIPSLVKREDLVIANTLANVTWSVMLAAGAAVGGIFAAIFGTNAALVFDALTFLAAGLLIWGMKLHTVPTTPKSETHTPHEKVTIAQGVRYLRQQPSLLAAMLVKFGGSLGNIDTLMTLFATQLFIVGDRGTLSLGIMYSVFGLGALTGPLILNRLNDGSTKQMRRLIWIGFILIAFGWVGLGIAGLPSISLWVGIVIVCIGLAVRAMGGSANWTYSSIILQKDSDDAFLGRMSSLDYTLFYVATVITTIGHGALIDYAGIENIPFVAALTFTIAIGIWLIWWRWIVRLERREGTIVGDQRVGITV